MILINKLPIPPKLADLKREAEEKGLSENEAYKNFGNPLKSEVRDLLMKEQGHLCAYCMRRIPDERIDEEDTELSKVYIEHWMARSSDVKKTENKSLDYNNMLAVCSGNEKAPEASRRKKRFFTCDKKRGNAPLKVNPLDLSTLESIYYSSDGLIMAKDEEIDYDINTRLNLNCSSDAVTLPKNRKNVLDNIQAAIVKQGGNFRENCIEQLHIWKNESDPKTPYIGIGIWWLKSQIQAMSEE